MNTPDFKLPLKPGHTSTEFWLTIAGGLLTTALAGMSLLDVTWATVAITVMTLAYNANRSKLKVIQAEAEAHAVKSATDVAAAQAMAGAEASPLPSNVIASEPLTRA